MQSFYTSFGRFVSQGIEQFSIGKQGCNSTMGIIYKSVLRKWKNEPKDVEFDEKINIMGKGYVIYQLSLNSLPKALGYPELVYSNQGIGDGRLDKGEKISHSIFLLCLERKYWGGGYEGTHICPFRKRITKFCIGIMQRKK